MFKAFIDQPGVNIQLRRLLFKRLLTEKGGGKGMPHVRGGNEARGV